MRRNEGSALLVTVLLLVMMGVIGFAALDTVTRDQQVAGFQKRQKTALYAAEAGVAEGLQTLATDGTPSVSATQLGDASTFPEGQPQYRLDTTAADPIEDIGVGAFPGMNLRLGQNGVPQYQMQFWRIRVQGEAPGGSLARLEVASGGLIAN